MLCLVCGAEMKLVQVVKDTRMFVSGYEHHTWQCSVCPAVERRMTFAGKSAPTMQSGASSKPTSILCLECGGEMSLVEVVQDTAMFVPGYEHHTWRCSYCSRVEKRMTFTRTPTQVPPMKLVELTASLGMLQMAAVETSHREPTAAMLRTITRAGALVEKLRGLKERSAAASAAARAAEADTARRAQFNRDWESFHQSSAYAKPIVPE